MTSVPASSERPEAPLFSDGLGDRVVAVDGATGDLLQILRLRPQLLSVPSFEFALRERAARLANFRHGYYARVRRIDRHGAGLAIVSDHVEGTRLSEILRVAAARRLSLDLNAALCLIRQLVPAVALLHENARDVAHGLIAPERLLVTPHARVVLVEHVLGSAVEQLQYTRDRLWQDLRVALPSTAGAPRFDHRADVTATGVVALSLVLGRPLAADEYPQRLATLLNDARARSAVGEEQPLPPAFRAWLARMLQIDARHGFATATEAQAALEEVLTEDTGFVAAPVALETFLSRYIAAVLEPAPAPRPVQPSHHVAAPAAVAPIVPEPPAPVRAASVAPPMPEPPAPVRPAAVAAAAPVVPEPPAPMRAVSMAPVIPAASSIVQHAAPVPPPAPVPEPRPAAAAAPPVAHIAAVPAATVVDTRAHAAPAFVEPTAAPVPASRAAVPPVVPHVGTPFTPFAPEPSGFDAAPAVPSAPAAPAAVPATGESAFAHTPDITELLKDFPGVVSNEAHEDDFAAAAPAPVARRFDRKQLMRLAAAVLVIAALGGGGWVYARSRGKGAVPATGTLSVQTNPPGVAVFVDGVSRGNTPARISVTAGSHIVELRGRGVPRVIPVQVTAGAEMSQYLEIPETPSTGSLLVQSDPAGARVTIDGVERGTAPLSVADLEPGDHEVVLVGSAGTPVKQHVVIQAGVTSSVLAPVSTATPGPVSGWLAVKAPVTIEIHEGGRLIGTTDSDKIMLAAGRHELQLVNDTLGYSAKRVVQVPAGKTLPLAIEMPQGTINLNATPWAEVWIDGRRVGETPIGNLSIPIGPHEVVFRHPQFGEKHQAISVTLSAPVRLSIDMK